MTRPIVPFATILHWRLRQSSAVRWGGALGLFAGALLLRCALGRLHGANPLLAFYPAILLASVLCGRLQALTLLAAAVATGIIWFLPPDMYLQPVGWVLVGGLNIAIIGMFEDTARALMLSNERQRLLFQELQHRVANTLQGAGGILEIARKRVVASPSDSVKLLEEAAQRIAASADVHRRLNDPTLFHRGLGSILHDAVSSIVEPHRVTLRFDVQELDLSFDQMSTLTMLVIEIANNAQKHVFRPALGSVLSVTLRAASPGRAMLIVSDDGPGIGSEPNAGTNHQGLGFRIMEGLARQLLGTLTVTPGRLSEIVVEFPTRSARDVRSR